MLAGAGGISHLFGKIFGDDTFEQLSVGGAESAQGGSRTLIGQVKVEVI
jgi:hypothetical protein